MCDGSSINALCYVKNRMIQVYCPRCKTKFLALLQEFKYDPDTKEFVAHCSCGHIGRIPYDTVQVKVADDGFKIEDVLVYIEEVHREDSTWQR